MADDRAQGTGPALNRLAITSAILAILWIFWVGSLFAVVLGRVATRQIKSGDDRGHALAGFGIVVGWLELLVGVLYLLWRLSGSRAPYVGGD